MVVKLNGGIPYEMLFIRWSKSKLGANSILAVSMAVCRAAAAASRMPLYDYIATLANYSTEERHFPIPAFNIINGGAHSGNSLAVQEFMILPVEATNFRHAMRIAAEVYQSLKVVLLSPFHIVLDYQTVRLRQYECR